MLRYLNSIVMAFLLVVALNSDAQTVIVEQGGKQEVIATPSRGVIVQQQPATEVNPDDLALVQRVGRKVTFFAAALRSPSFVLGPQRPSKLDDGRPSVLIPADLFKDLLQVEQLDRRSGLNYSAAGQFWVTIAAAIATTGATADADRAYAKAFSAMGTSIEDHPLGRVYALIGYAYFLLNNGRLDDAAAVLEDVGRLLSRIPDHSSPTIQQMLRAQQEGAQGAFFPAQAQIALMKRNWSDAVTYAQWGLHFNAWDPRRTAQLNAVLALGLAGEREKLPEAEQVIRESVARLDESFSFFSRMNLNEWLCPCDTSRLVLADILARQGKWSQAATEAQRALEKIPATLPQAKFWKAYGHQTLAQARRHFGEPTKSLDSVRLAIEAYEALDHSDFFIQSYRALDPRVLAQEGLLAKAPALRLLDDEILAFVQLPQRSGLNGAIDQMASRYALSDAGAASLVREQQDLASYLRAFGAERSKLMGSNNAAAAKQMDAKYLAAIERQSNLENEIARAAPQYAALSSRRPVSLRQLSQNLRDDEALIAWHIGEEGAWAIVVRKGASHIVPISARFATIRDQAKQFRSMVELQTGSSLGIFPARQAYELYEKLFGAVSDKLEGIKHAYVVPDAAILDLPMAALVVTQPPKPLINPDDSASFRNTKWLIDQFAVTVLPSISSLVVLRSLEQRSSREGGFFGVGDPTFRRQASAPDPSKVIARSAPMDIGRIPLLQPLPETANELVTIGKFLAKDGGTILLGEKATESAVKQANLDRYKVVSFATHGVVAGELSGVREPGLILTTPKIATEEDDGILTASEISLLKLRADWVILSACNTAAGDSASNNAPLEGLARAFFYAGANSMLVSHWAVDSLSTVELTTRTVQFAAESKSSFALSHQKAMKAMIQSGKPNFAHPSAWAAFFVVGVTGTPN